jgi:hypothetical protein
MFQIRIEVQPLLKIIERKSLAFGHRAKGCELPGSYKLPANDQTKEHDL